MTDTSVGGSSLRRAAPSLTNLDRATVLRTLGGFLVIAGLLTAAAWLHRTPGYGAGASFSLLTGLALGFLFERGRFCFFCIFRDFIEDRNSEPLYAVLAALAVGGVGYAVVFGAFLPSPIAGRLPPEAHIGPVSWALALAGFAFGIGMALSGACISGHLYRLGEGYSRAPLALSGALVGFGLGFYTWNTLYLTTIAGAPAGWLPAWLGYGGALALALLRFVPLQPARIEQRIDLRSLHHALFGSRWNPLVTGALVGVIGVFAYLRVEPLGVTAQLGSISRTLLNDAGLLLPRLNGLDTLAGCATQVVQAITDNGWLIGGFVLASLAAALLANRFELSKLTPGNSVTALLGGLLMGWGSMTALGCTVGTLLSGISAFSLSGWVFAVAVFVGVIVGVKLGFNRF
jgi:uncharacterized membrane protein YedE/YeeE